ncbi:AraC family transcriptional regulator [Streptomyces sp. HNM0574]|uniref:helix-turn-helix domain-containing protein n=1 Tax=Streptomyces sp. HNM0574 TaxID=2714954 RepID=UPI00146E1430|nr:AraC family transcriptional regulator [Streptomyces sp. HNM0574]NLU69371.1 AraC family transcriptional regulator [Streptomyces sp. HNM0574]
MPLHRLDVPEPHRLPFAIGTFDTIGPLSRAAFPHRHTFYEIAFVTGGRGAHVVDLCRRPLRPPHLCVITPGQVHHWEDVSGLQGWVVLFDDVFLMAHPGDRELLRVLGEQPPPRLDDRAAAETASVLTQMRRESEEHGEAAASVLQAYLHILCVRASRARTPAGGAAARPGRAAALAREFARLLTLPGGAARNSVRSWAAELGVSVSYLHEVVKGTTGRTPAQLIRETQVLEAKRLLAGTGLPVGRVARELGFADPAYFCRFFRRETGLTPGAFREAAGGRTGGIHHGHRSPSIDRPVDAS